MKTEQEEFGKHPMTDAEIDAFFNRHSTPPRGAIIPLEVDDEQKFTIPQFIQMLAKTNGYKVVLTKM